VEVAKVVESGMGQNLSAIVCECYRMQQLISITRGVLRGLSRLNPKEMRRGQVDGA